MKNYQSIQKEAIIIANYNSLEEFINQMLGDEVVHYNSFFYSGASQVNLYRKEVKQLWSNQNIVGRYKELDIDMLWFVIDIAKYLRIILENQKFSTRVLTEKMPSGVIDHIVQFKTSNFMLQFRTHSDIDMFIITAFHKDVIAEDYIKYPPQLKSKSLKLAGKFYKGLYYPMLSTKSSIKTTDKILTFFSTKRVLKF